MKPHRRLAATVERLLGLIACLSAGTITHGASELQMEWPRVMFRDGVTNTVFQPQLLSWDYLTLKAVCRRRRSAEWRGAADVWHDSDHGENARGPRRAHSVSGTA